MRHVSTEPLKFYCIASDVIICRDCKEYGSHKGRTRLAGEQRKIKEDLGVPCGKMAAALATNSPHVFRRGVVQALGGLQCVGGGANAVTEAKDTVTAHFDQLIQVEQLCSYRPSLAGAAGLQLRHGALLAEIDMVTESKLVKLDHQFTSFDSGACL